ncbi:hypothetical protein C8J56DRAFT_1163991 [Mycena floridula]|nr:hypothetical protein C8J56DRAFT_1163991 [Mycena floridula]
MSYYPHYHQQPYYPQYQPSGHHYYPSSGYAPTSPYMNRGMPYQTAGYPYQQPQVIMVPQALITIVLGTIIATEENRCFKENRRPKSNNK